MTAQHPLDESVRLESLGNGRYRGDPPKHYWNIVGPYGGISAAIAVHAVQQEENVVGDPLALTVNFTAPVQDLPFDLAVRAVRSSRTTQHWVIEMEQPARRGDGMDRVLQAMLTTGLRRELWSEQTITPPAAPLPVAESRRRTARAGLPWFDRYDQRFTGHPMKPDNAADPVLTWVRDDPPRPLDYPALAAICDSFFPNIFSHRQKFIPIATVSMNTYFHLSATELADVGTDYLLTRSGSGTYQQGFSDAQGEVWAGDRLIATSQQVMWYGE